MNNHEDYLKRGEEKLNSTTYSNQKKEREGLEDQNRNML